MNVSEGGRHQFVASLLLELGPAAIVPWPVYVESMLWLHGRGFVHAAVRFARGVLTGEVTLATPTSFEHSTALDIVERYAGFGVDLPDAVCIAMAMARQVPLLTWDFRHARAVVVNGRSVQLAVTEAEFHRL